MRVCPKCEFADSPYWRHSRYNNWLDFMEFENFLTEYPELAKQLLEGEKVRTNKSNKIEDIWNVYVKSRRSKYVYRCCKLDGSWMYSFHGLGEKRNHNDPDQTKLLEMKE